MPGPGSRSENRLVTVLVAAVSCSAQTGHERQPEAVAALLHRLLGVMVDVVLKYEGQVDRLHWETVCEPSSACCQSTRMIRSGRSRRRWSSAKGRGDWDWK